MAKSTKPIKKRPVKDVKKDKSEEQENNLVASPFKIIIEVVVRNESSLPVQQNEAFIAEVASLPTNNFSYTFSRQGATILKLVVESFQKDTPQDSGSFFAPVLDPHNPKKVRVMVVARQDTPGGSATLSLKYETKDVFTSPRAIDFRNGIGGINELVTLPS